MGVDWNEPKHKVAEEKSSAVWRGYSGSDYSGEHFGDHEIGKFMGRHKNADHSNEPLSGWVFLPALIVMILIALTWFPTQFAWRIAAFVDVTWVALPIFGAMLIALIYFALVTVGFSRIGVFAFWFCLTIAMCLAALALHFSMGNLSTGRLGADDGYVSVNFMMSIMSFALFIGISFLLRYYAFRRFGSYRVRRFGRLVFKRKAASDV